MYDLVNELKVNGSEHKLRQSPNYTAFCLATGCIEGAPSLGTSSATCFTFWDKLYDMLDHLNSHLKLHGQYAATTPHPNQASWENYSTLGHVGEIFLLFGGGRGLYDQAIIDKIKQDLHFVS